MRTPYIFFGTPYVARDTLAALIDAGYTPLRVITSPDSLRGRGLQLTPCETKVFAEEHGISVMTPAELTPEIIKEIAVEGPAFAIVVAYGKIIPQELIDAFPLGILNVHYSLLPKYRGASPVEAALLHGDTETGVTIQQMAFKLDAGDILAQEAVTLAITETAHTLKPKLISLGADLLVRTLPSFIDGTVSRTVQDDGLATRARKIKKEEGQLDLGGDPLTNWNTYRAYIESPGTYFMAQKDGQSIRVKIKEARYENGRFIIDRIVPEGKSEQPFSYLAERGYTPA